MRACFKAWSFVMSLDLKVSLRLTSRFCPWACRIVWGSFTASGFWFMPISFWAFRRCREDRCTWYGAWPRARYMRTWTPAWPWSCLSFSVPRGFRARTHLPIVSAFAFGTLPTRPGTWPSSRPYQNYFYFPCYYFYSLIILDRSYWVWGFGLFSWTRYRSKSSRGGFHSGMFDEYGTGGRWMFDRRGMNRLCFAMIRIACLMFSGSCSCHSTI